MVSAIERASETAEEYCPTRSLLRFFARRHKANEGACALTRRRPLLKMKSEVYKKMRDMEKILEMDKIKAMLKELACTKKAKEEIAAMNPILSARKVKAALRDTTQARQLMEHLGNPPLTSFANMEEYLACARQGGCLIPEQLEEVAQTLAAVSRLKGYLNKGKTWQIGLSWYEENLNPMDAVREEISRMIRGGRVDDYATGWLRDIRREIAGLSGKGIPGNSDGSVFHHPQRQNLSAGEKTVPLPHPRQSGGPFLHRQYLLYRACVPDKAADRAGRLAAGRRK